VSAVALLLPVLWMWLLPLQAAVPQTAAIDKLLADADAARLAADFTRMQSLSEEAVAASRALADAGRLARSLTLAGNALFLQSQPSACVPFAREAAAVIAPLNTPAAEAATVNSLANCLRGAGNFEEAIDWYRRAAELSRAAGDAAREGNVLSNIAVVYSRLGEFDLARQTAEQAASRARASQNAQVEVYALQVLGNAYGVMGEHALAVATHGRALARLDDLPASNIVSFARAEELDNIGVFQCLDGHFDAAIASLTRAREVSGSAAPYPLSEAIADTYLGWSAYRLNRLDDAERWFTAARAAWRTVDDASMANDMLLSEIGYARVLRARGRDADALAIDQAALVTLDRLRAGRNVTGTSGATSLLPATRAYADTIDLLISLGRSADAFDVSERYRARLFLDTLDDRRNGIGQSMTDAERARETSLADEAVKVQTRLWDPQTPAAARRTLEARLGAIDQDLDALRREVRRQDPRYGRVRFPELMTAGAVTGSLAPDTAMLSFVLGDDRSFVFALTPDGVTAAVLPAGKTIEARAAAFSTLLATRPVPGISRLTRVRAQASALTAMLLSPVTPALRGKTHLIVLPDGALSALPFEALAAVAGQGFAPPRGAWLAEQFALSYAPSASALIAVGERAAAAGTRSVVAFGDPLTLPPFTSLPYARIEVDRIARVFGASARTVTGRDATPEAFAGSAAAGYRYIHLAAHGFVNPVRPGRSGLVLAPNPGATAAGILEADAVTRLSLNADLVTLSACSTALGKTVAGEGVMGLARSFLIAGARSVAASLWNVNDEATATLMVKLYSGLKAGLPPDEALSAARRLLMRGANERLKDPYYWAPFVLIGSAR
jgi:tetratricopeptide (TPR) repeat protein